MYRLFRVTWVRMILGIGMLCVSGPAQAALGDLDPAFGTSGKVVLDVGSAGDTAHTVAIQHDGKMVVGGHSGLYAVSLERFLPDGTLDTTFGSGGIVLTDLGSPTAYKSIAELKVLSSGKIIATGHVGNKMAVMRFHVDGSLDTSYGTGGFSIVDFPNMGTTYGGDIVILPFDKAVVAGSCYNSSSFEWDVCLAQFRSSGVLDTSFGTGGMVTMDANMIIDEEGLKALAVQTDGKLVAAGYTGEGAYSSSVLVMRFLANGVIDSAFGTDGMVVASYSSQMNRAIDVMVRADGSIMALGNSETDSKTQRLLLVSLQPDGQFNTNFAGTGYQFITSPSGKDLYAAAGLLQANGKIVIAGYMNNFDLSGTPEWTQEFHYLLAWCNRDGSIENVGTEGLPGGGTASVPYRTYSVIANQNEQLGLATALQQDGNIVVAGYLDVDPGLTVFDIGLIRIIGDPVAP